MKKVSLFKLISAGILATGMTVAPAMLPVSAQVGVPEPEGVIVAYEEDDGFDWGWLGLLGLIGLVGLAGGGGKRRNEDATAYRDPNRTVTAYRDPNR